MKRVLVALSGGVDSSVTAILLKNRDFEVIGATMDISDSSYHCVDKAKTFCDQIGIPHIVLDLKKDFQNLIIKDFVNSYRSSKTPNPCILCNRFIKFGLLYNELSKQNCDYFATGHYANIIQYNGKTYIARASNIKKDQSYFLFGIEPHKLEKILFPLGTMTKEEVKEIAKSYNLKASEYKESQDVCFIPDGDYRKFLIPYIKENEIQRGDILTTKGVLLGKHEGLHNYTIGQKKGLGLNYHQSLYVVKLNNTANQLIVGEKDDLLIDYFEADNINIFDEQALNDDAIFDIQTRFRSMPVKGKIILIGNDKFLVKLEEKIYGVSLGQAVVAYSNDRIVGGGWISE